jgi:hypothetical protein
MNHEAMERALGKLVMDRGFRAAFFCDPSAASAAAGIPLDEHEWTALTRIRPGALEAFERYLHAKLAWHEWAAA